MRPSAGLPHPVQRLTEAGLPIPGAALGERPHGLEGGHLGFEVPVERDECRQIPGPGRTGDYVHDGEGSHAGEFDQAQSRQSRLRLLAS